MPKNLPNILIVDDEPDMCWVLENILTIDGYAVMTAINGAEALELLAQASYIIAFLDAKLPDLEGMELAVLIRQRSPHTKVIIVSGYFYQEDIMIIEGLEKKLYAGFVAKPFDLDEIRLVTHRAVELARKEGYSDVPNSFS